MAFYVYRFPILFLEVLKTNTIHALSLHMIYISIYLNLLLDTIL